MKRFALLTLAVMLTGCAAMHSGTTAQTPYGTAARLGDDVAQAVNQADSTVDAWRVQGLLNANDERNFLSWTNSLNSLDMQYINCVKAAKGQTALGIFTACAKTFSAGIGDPATLQALHVMNPASQAKVTALAQGIVNLITTTISALGGN